MNHDPRETEYYNKGESDLSDSTEDTLEQGDFVPQNSIADEPGEELATLRIEPGLARGFDDIEQGRFEEVSDASRGRVWMPLKGKRGRGAYGKTTVFGIFERDGQVYTEIVPDCSKATLQGIIRGQVDPATAINSDGWRGYNGLVDLGYGHFRVDHSKDEFARGRVHINGIEGFWGMAKVWLAKFKGLPKHTFHLHLKETEWRYNNRASDKPKLLLRYLRENPLS